MWDLRRFARLGTAFHALELTAEQAGHAWACPFASSDEYEAAVIQAKRAAGVYGPRRHRRHIFLLAVAFVALTSPLLLIL